MGVEFKNFPLPQVSLEASRGVAASIKIKKTPSLDIFQVIVDLPNS